MIKKFFSVVLILTLLTMLLGGCAPKNSEDSTANSETSAGDAKEEKIKVAYVTMDAGNPYFVNIVEGMKEQANKSNIEFTLVDPKWDSVQQINGIENLVVQGVDAIIVSPIDANSVEGAMKKAQSSGIKVVGLNTPIVGADANITVDEYQYGFEGGKLAGQWIKDHLNGEAEVAILAAPDLKTLIDRQRGLEEGVLSIAPKAKIVATQPGNTVEFGMKSAETILQSNPNVKVFAAVNDAGALGAMEAVKAAGKATEDFYVGGLDATQEALDKMKESGSIYRATVDLDPVGAGRLTMDTTIKVLKDGPIKEYIYMEMSPLTQNK